MTEPFETNAVIRLTDLNSAFQAAVIQRLRPADLVSIDFHALKTCGSTDNGADVLYIQANGYNSETRELADIAGYIWQYGDGEEEY